jgi:hypothetical protein
MTILRAEETSCPAAGCLGSTGGTAGHPRTFRLVMLVVSAILVVLGLIAGTIGFVAPSVTGIGLCLMLLLLAGALMDGRLTGGWSRGAHRLD